METPLAVEEAEVLLAGQAAEVLPGVLQLEAITSLLEEPSDLPSLTSSQEPFPRYSMGIENRPMLSWIQFYPTFASTTSPSCSALI